MKSLQNTEYFCMNKQVQNTNTSLALFLKQYSYNYDHQ